MLARLSILFVALSVQSLTALAETPLTGDDPLPTVSEAAGISETVVGGHYLDSALVGASLADSSTATSNPMLWQQYQALQSGVAIEGRDCQACSSGGAGGYDRCGCNPALFHWIDGPGNCDQWCVGPKWGVDAGGLMMFRDDADWNRVIADVGGNPAAAGFSQSQFDHGPGGRVFVTGYNESGFGIQVGYEGINDWSAVLAFAPDDPVAGQTRRFNYESRLNSVEINFVTNNPSPWKLFSGFRYVQFDEDFIDFTRDDANRFVPAPGDPPATTQPVDLQRSQLLENRLFGLQLGGRRDAWQLGNRLVVQSFANAGVYCNKFRRDDVDVTITTTITGDDTSTTDVTELTESSSSFRTTTRDNLTEIAFVGEAGVTGSWRLNHCTAVRAGYQILVLDGVAQGLEASFIPGFSADTLVFHGLQFGLEYRR